ncbi:MAG: hypothetical protein ACXWLG_01355 [Myxococcaceae bacterium]
MTACRTPIVHQAMASLLVAALGGYPVRALADQGAPAQSVPVQSVPPPPSYAPPPPQYAPPAQQAPPVAQPQQQYAPPAQQAPPYAQPPQQYAPPAQQAPQGYAPPPQQQYAPPAQQAPQGYAQPPGYAPPAQAAPQPGAPAAAATGAAVGAAAGAAAVGDVPAAAPKLPPGAVPVPQSAAPAPAKTGEADIGSAPAPAPPPATSQKSAPVNPQLIRLEWRPAYVDGNRGWGPMIQVPVIGPEKRPLQGPSLYSALGRPDLAEEYERRAAAKRLMGTGSVLLLVSGIAVGISALFIPTCQPGQVQCWNNRDAQLQSRLYWSGGLVLGGAVLGIASSSYSANPVSRDQLMGLIRQHNNQILGKPGVQVGAMALPGGGGLTLAGNF